MPKFNLDSSTDKYIIYHENQLFKANKNQYGNYINLEPIYIMKGKILHFEFIALGFSIFPNDPEKKGWIDPFLKVKIAKYSIEPKINYLSKHIDYSINVTLFHAEVNDLNDNKVKLEIKFDFVIESNSKFPFLNQLLEKEFGIVGLNELDQYSKKVFQTLSELDYDNNFFSYLIPKNYDNNFVELDIVINEIYNNFDSYNSTFQDFIKKTVKGTHYQIVLQKSDFPRSIKTEYLIKISQFCPILKNYFETFNDYNPEQLCYYFYLKLIELDQ
jgi:hypothetical protein